jgi:hypothetical protein
MTCAQDIEVEAILATINESSDFSARWKLWRVTGEGEWCADAKFQGPTLRVRAGALEWRFFTGFCRVSSQSLDAHNKAVATIATFDSMLGATVVREPTAEELATIRLAWKVLPDALSGNEIVALTKQAPVGQECTSYSGSYAAGITRVGWRLSGRGPVVLTMQRVPPASRTGERSAKMSATCLCACGRKYAPRLDLLARTALR